MQHKSFVAKAVSVALLASLCAVSYAEQTVDSGTSTISISRYTAAHLNTLFTSLKEKDGKKKKSKYKEKVTISINPLSADGCANEDPKQRTHLTDWPTDTLELAAQDFYVQITRSVQYRRKNALSCLSAFTVRLEPGSAYELKFYELTDKSCLVELVDGAGQSANTHIGSAMIKGRGVDGMKFCRAESASEQDSGEKSPLSLPSAVLTEDLKQKLEQEGVFDMVEH